MVLLLIHSIILTISTWYHITISISYSVSDRGHGQIKGIWQGKEDRFWLAWSRGLKSRRFENSTTHIADQLNLFSLEISCMEEWGHLVKSSTLSAEERKLFFIHLFFVYFSKWIKTSGSKNHDEVVTLQVPQWDTPRDETRKATVRTRATQGTKHKMVSFYLLYSTWCEFPVVHLGIQWFSLLPR